MAKIKKAQMGAGVPKGKAKTEMGKTVDKKEFMARQDSMAKAMDKQRASLGKKKMKNGGKAKSFPDLNKDGKVTKADILKGRGVIAKKGASMKKCKYGCK
jgi:hypothetical protein